MKKKILILQTGGTISMLSAKGKLEKGLKPVSHGKDFLKVVPELSRIAQIEVLVLDNIDSSNVSPRHWERWIKELKNNYSKYDGFVVTHGTDSMVYTAAAFSFALEGHQKPVVFTGSQRPLGLIRSDASINLINSVETACRGPHAVTLCFGNKLLLGVRSMKFSAKDFVAFESFNFPHLATFGVEYESTYEGFLENSMKTKAVWKNRFNENIFCFKIFPGISGKILLNTIQASACEGIVLEAYGSGNVPSLDDSVLAMLKVAKKLKKPVVIVSQCPHGRVDLEKYDCGLKAQKQGAISAGDMTREASVVKLMHGLGQGLRGESLKSYFQKNICGERTK